MRLGCGRGDAIFAVAALCILGLPASAQVPTGTILGTVKDQQGLPIAGATATLTNQETSRAQTNKTSSRGGYEFTHLNFGTYSVDVSSPGFKNSIVMDIKLDASTEYSVPPIVLEVGSVSEKVTVEGGANLVRTAGAEITDTVESKQIEELPIYERNPMNLLNLQAGVSQNGRSETVINGQRQSFSNVTLDGINIQDNFIRTDSLDYTPNYLFMSQVGEFTTTNQNAGSQAGMGSSQVSIVTPGGTNTWHGEGFWYYKTAAWSANDWFNDANGVAKPNLLLNQAGGDIGGPIRKDKLLVYGAYELYHLRQQLSTPTTVLSSTARNGIFQWRDKSNTLQCARVVVVPGVTLPPGCSELTSSGQPALDQPVIANMLAQVPTKTNDASIGDGLNTSGYLFNQRANNSRSNVSARLDWQPSARHSFSGTYAWNRYFADRPGLSLGLANTYSAVPVVYNKEDDNFLSAAWRWIPTSNFTNEVRFGFNLSPINFFTTQQFEAPQQFGSGQQAEGCQQAGACTVSNTIFNNPYQNEFPSTRHTHTWSWQDNASWAHGNHLLNFGMQVQRVTVFAQAFANTVPNLNLDYTQSGNASLLGSPFSGGISDQYLATANQLLATLAGLVGSESQTFNVTSTTSGYVPSVPQAQNFRYNTWSLYFGDSWRFRRYVTFTYGLRWEYNSPFSERDGLLQFPLIPVGQTVQQTLLSDATLAYVGGNTGRIAYQKHLRDFAPNFGVAWDPIGDGRTSIRAGYSINYVNDELIGAPYNASLSNPGVSTQTGPNLLKGVVASNPQSIPVPTLSNTFSGNWVNLYGFNTFNSYGYAVDPNLSTPYVQQWNLSVQREVGWNSSVTVSYIGNRGAKLYRAIDLNQVIINGNGFLQAFNAERQNGFLAVAAHKQFNPNYDSSIPGSQPVPYFNNNFLFGDLWQFFPGLVDQYLEQGAVGDLADLYHGTGSDSSYLYNFYGAGTTAPVALSNNQYLHAADLLGNFSYSNYNAGSVEFRRRFRRGLNIQANYTFSKVYTDYSADTLSGVQRFFPYLDNANPRLEKERANFDLTHGFKANFLYQLPFGKGQGWSPANGVLNRFVSGWTTSSIFTWQSGAPFSVFSGEGTLNRLSRSQLTNTAYTTSTPQQISGQLGVYQSGGEIFLINPKYAGPDGRGAPNDALTCAPVIAGGFCNPQPGTVGNLPRNAFNGPPFFNWDFSLLKSIPITESKLLKVRVDLFNAPNHPTFAVGDPTYGTVTNPGGSSSDMYINDPKFGVAQSTASSPRIVQVGAVFSF